MTRDTELAAALGANPAWQGPRYIVTFDSGTTVTVCAWTARDARTLARDARARFHYGGPGERIVSVERTA